MKKMVQFALSMSNFSLPCLHVYNSSLSLTEKAYFAYYDYFHKTHIIIYISNLLPGLFTADVKLHKLTQLLIRTQHIHFIKTKD